MNCEQREKLSLTTCFLDEALETLQALRDELTEEYDDMPQDLQEELEGLQAKQDIGDICRFEKSITKLQARIMDLYHNKKDN